MDTDNMTKLKAKTMIPKYRIMQYMNYQSLGFINPVLVQRSLNQQFLQQLELSKHKEVQNVTTGAVNHIQVDTTEHRYLLSGCSDGCIAIHDLQNPSDEDGQYNSGQVDTLTYRLVCTIFAGNRHAHTRSIETVQWYPLDTGIFTSSGADRLLKIWDANRLQTAEEYTFSNIVHCHHMSPIATRHSLMAVGTDSSVVKLIDPRAGSATHSLRGHREGAVRAVRWSNKDEFILASGGIDNFAMLWDVRTAKGCLMKMKDSCGKKKSGYHRDTSHDGSVNGLEFTSDGQHLLTLGTDQKMFAWDTITGKKLPTRFPPLSHIKKRSVKFCLTGVGSEDVVFIPTGSSITNFGLSSGRKGKVRHMYGHYNSVNCTAYHSEGLQMLSGGNDHKILVWSVKGDSDYGRYLREKRVLEQEKRDRKLRTLVSVEEESQVVELHDAGLAHTVDTWSDDDDDGEEEEGDSRSKTQTKTRR